MRRERALSSKAKTNPPVSILLVISLVLSSVFLTPQFPEAQAAPVVRAGHVLSIPCRGGEYFDFTPLGLAFDASGRLYIVDADNSRIMVLRDSFEDMRPFSDFYRDSVGVHFVDVEIRDGLTVYVSEENGGTLVGFDRTGQPRALVQVGPGVAGFGIGAAGKACVANPVYELIRIVYIDGDRETVDVTMAPEAGHVLYVDCLVLAEGKFLATAAGHEHLLHFNAVGNYAGPFSRHRFSEPYGLASFMGDYVLVSDVGNKEIVVLDMKGNRIGSFGSSILDEPTFLAVRRDGTVCVSDTRRRTIEVFKIEIE
jgi:DNA-binding beta-propeller fold protein YncE